MIRYNKYLSKDRVKSYIYQKDNHIIEVLVIDYYFLGILVFRSKIEVV